MTISSDNHAYIASCRGYIAIRPRMLDLTIKESVIKVHTIFDLKIEVDLYDHLSDQLHSMDKSYIYRKVQALFEKQDAVYTNEVGVIEAFNPPNLPWWIVIESVVIHKYIPKLTSISAYNPVVIDGEVISSENLSAKEDELNV